MSQGKKSKFLPIYFSVLGAGALGLGYLGWSASSSAEEAETKYKSALSELDRLESAKLSRTRDNAAEKAKMVKTYVDQVEELNKTLKGYQAPVNAAETNESFQKKLLAAIKSARENGQGKSVKVDEKFDFGLGKYLSGFPIPGTAPQLSAQLDALVFLTNAAMDAGISEINNLSRKELPIEKEPKEEDPKKPKPKPTVGKPKVDEKAKAKVAPVLLDESKVLERQALTLTGTGKNRSILALLESLANASPDKAPHFFVIRTLRIENQLKDGPPKTQAVEMKEEPDPNNKEVTIKRDAAYLLGNEPVILHLDLDLLRFLDEEAPADKDKAAAKSKDKAPADK